MAPRDEQGRWLKGTSPNPGGRPKGRGLQAEIEHQLLECPVGSNETRMERIARVLLDMCEAGDTRALELLPPHGPHKDALSFYLTERP